MWSEVLKALKGQWQAKQTRLKLSQLMLWWGRGPGSNLLLMEQGPKFRLSYSHMLMGWETKCETL